MDETYLCVADLGSRLNAEYACSIAAFSALFFRLMAMMRRSVSAAFTLQQHVNRNR
jgi:hypothetical protein